MNGIVHSMDNCKFVPLVLLDLSVTFDTVDHGILLEVLHKLIDSGFSVNDIPLSWFCWWLTSSTRSISVNGGQSERSVVVCRVAQGPVLGSVQFTCYTEDVVEAFHSNSVRHHLFADDQQLYSTTTILMKLVSVSSAVF